MIVILMGVAGAGKTTVGESLAQRLGARFIEGDTFHPAANVEKMRAGTPLSDDDRLPWLAAIAGEIGRCLARGETAVIACSALKRAYRTILIGGRAAVRVVHLEGTPSLIQARLDARRGHYMPASLLPSQFAALEPPATDEAAVSVDVSGAPQDIVAAICAALNAGT
ncbi:MAG TPA: gluconokinase [Alphaproteobacteria bacterium]